MITARSVPLTIIYSLLAFLRWSLSGAFTEASCPVPVTSALLQLLPVGLYSSTPRSPSPSHFHKTPPAPQPERQSRESLNFIHTPGNLRGEATFRVGGVEKQFLSIYSFCRQPKNKLTFQQGRHNKYFSNHTRCCKMTGKQ